MRNVGEKTTVGVIGSERLVLDNRYFSVIERVIKTPDGITREPQLLWDRAGKSFAVAVGLTVEGSFVLVREPKYGQMRRFLSVPTGGVKKGEPPADAAAREFLEETGYEITEWRLLRSTPVVDFADKSDGGEHYFFFGIGATRKQDPESEREVVIVTPDQAMEMLLGTAGLEPIELAMSFVGITLALAHLKR